MTGETANCAVPVAVSLLIPGAVHSWRYLLLAPFIPGAVCSYCRSSPLTCSVLTRVSLLLLLG